MLRVMNYVYSDFLFMGPTEQRTVTELLFGYKQTDITSRLNTGSVTDGNIYYNEDVFPVFVNTDMVTTPSASFEIFSPNYVVSTSYVEMDDDFVGQIEQ